MVSMETPPGLLLVLAGLSRHSKRTCPDSEPPYSTRVFVKKHSLILFRIGLGFVLGFICAAYPAVRVYSAMLRRQALEEPCMDALLAVTVLNRLEDGEGGGARELLEWQLDDALITIGQYVDDPRTLGDNRVDLDQVLVRARDYRRRCPRPRRTQWDAAIAKVLAMAPESGPGGADPISDAPGSPIPPPAIRVGTP